MVRCLLALNLVNAIIKQLLNSEIMHRSLLLVILATVLKSVSGKDLLLNEVPCVCNVRSIERGGQMIRAMYDSRRSIGRFAQDDSRKHGDDSCTDGNDSRKHWL